MLLRSFQFALALLPFSALAVTVSYQDGTRVQFPTYVVAATGPSCTKECDSKYAKCTKRSGGKDMKQCADVRRVCYRRCS